MTAAESATPRVSTVIPCWNGAAYLAEALASVRAQDVAGVEVIVCDDGSTDASVEIAHASGAQVVTQDHRGAAAARNLGVRSARGGLLAFLDADDLWTAGRLARLVAALDADPTLDLVMGETEQFVSPEVPEADRARFRFDPGPMAARLSGALVVRRPAFDRVGEFSTALTTGEFVDWYNRADEVGLRMATLPLLVLRRRLHLSNHGVVRKDARQDYVNLIKAALERRRRLAGGASA